MPWKVCSPEAEELRLALRTELWDLQDEPLAVACQNSLLAWHSHRQRASMAAMAVLGCCRGSSGPAVTTNFSFWREPAFLDVRLFMAPGIESVSYGKLGVCNMSTRLQLLTLMSTISSSSPTASSQRCKARLQALTFWPEELFTMP